MGRFSRQSSYKKKHFKKTILLVCGVIFVFFTGIAFYGISRLQIKSVEITGVQFIDSGDLEKIIKEELDKGFFKSNLLALPKKRITAEIEKKFKIESFAFSRRWPNILHVNIKEAAPAAFWATSGQSYEPIEESEGEIKAIGEPISELSNIFFIDKRGVILHEWQKPTIEEAEEETADWPLLDQPKIFAAKIHQNLPLIVDLEGKETLIGNQVLADYGLSDIEKFNRIFSKEKFAFEVKYFSFPSASKPKELRVMTNRGFWIMLSRDTDWEQIAENLSEAIIKNKISDIDKLSYIDLRLNDRMFFK